MAHYRKKPVVIEACQFDSLSWDGDSYSVMFNTTDSLPEWLLNALIKEDIFAVKPDQDFLHIKTLEGVMEAESGDWIIKGVKGELYPCKPDIFALTYDQAPAPEHDVAGVAI